MSYWVCCRMFLLTALALAVAWGGGRLWPEDAAAGGMVRYQAGNLLGPPDPSENGKNSDSVRQERDGVHYRAGTPQEAWHLPWVEEWERQEKSWDLLDNTILEVHPQTRPSRPPPAPGKSGPP